MTSGKRLAGRTALVVGGAGNIGSAACRALAAQGGRVILTGRDRKKGQERAAEIISAGGAARFVEHEVTEAGAWSSLFTDVTQHEGVPDVVVCSAGKAFLASFEKSSATDLRDVLAVNLEGVYHAARHAFAAWRATGKGGNFIAISGINGLRGSGNASIHSASKGCMTGLIRGLAAEGVADGISANTIHPSLTWPGGKPPPRAAKIFGAERLAAHMANTKAVTPLGRIGEPEDIADAIVFLAAQKRPAVTGQQILVEGGRLGGEFRR